MRNLENYYKDLETSHGKDVANEVRLLDTLFDDNIYIHSLRTVAVLSNPYLSSKSRFATVASAKIIGSFL